MKEDKRQHEIECYNSIVSIAREHISSFEHAGFGMYNLYGVEFPLKRDGKNYEDSVIVQVYPYEEEGGVYVLPYYYDENNYYDHDDLILSDFTDEELDRLVAAIKAAA